MRYLLCALLGACVATAADPPGDIIDQQFRRLDKDKDGKLTAEELKASPVIARLLDGGDANKDGLLTLEEVRIHFATHMVGRDPKPGSKLEPVRQGPKVLKPGDHGVGRQAPDVAYTDVHGKAGRLSDLKDKKAVVVAFTSTSCPLSKKFSPALSRMEKAFRDKGVAFVFVNPVATDELAVIRDAIKAHDLAGPYVHDVDGKFATGLGASVTTDAFVLDPARTVVYRGAVNDQYGQGYAHDEPRRHYLADALDAVLAGKAPVVAATEAPGCALDLKKERSATAVTYHRDISRLVQAHCVECHRKDGVAPFSLETYKDVVAHAGEIRRVVERGTMPPWFAAPSEKGPSPWVNDRSLAKSEKADLLTWLAGGRAEGDPADAPRPRTFAAAWQIGTPDAVVRPKKPVRVKAEGTMPYQNVFVETDFGEDKWVQAIEVRPTAKQVVHHVLVFVVPPPGAKTEELPGRVVPNDGLTYYAIYVPGNSATVFPPGFGKHFPKGSRVHFQIHYTPNGTATDDATELGLVFARERPKHVVRVLPVVNTGFAIPPGADNHQVTALMPLPFNAKVLGFLPHMHVRGKAFRYEVIEPGAKPELLLDVPRYDFNWQLLYTYAEPRPVPRGSVLRATGWFDNSDGNPANPDPTKTVRWGLQTYEEMMLGYVEFYIP